MDNRVWVFGASGHARVVLDALSCAGRWQVAGLLDPGLRPGSLVDGHKVVGGDELLPELIASTGITQGVVALGDNRIRWRCAQAIRHLCPAFRFVTVIHPTAQLAEGVEPGAGCVVFARARIGAGCRLGAHSLINTRAVLEEGITLADAASVAPASHLESGVRLGFSAAVNLGSRVRKNCQLGAVSVLGAGSDLHTDLPAGRLAWGQPACLRG